MEGPDLNEEQRVVEIREGEDRQRNRRDGATQQELY